MTRPLALQHVTVVDTRLSLHGPENASSQSFQGQHNQLETEILDDVLFHVSQHRGNSFLSDHIIVKTPYRAQLCLKGERLSKPTGFLAQHQNLNVKVDTIDAMQGSERSIVLISLTRSNINATIGFLREDNRLNVSFTGAQHLLIIIWDFNTL